MFRADDGLLASYYLITCSTRVGAEPFDDWIQWPDLSGTGSIILLETTFGLHWNTPTRPTGGVGCILLNAVLLQGRFRLHRKIKQTTQRIDVRTYNARAPWYFVLAFPALQQGFDHFSAVRIGDRL